MGGKSSHKVTLTPNHQVQDRIFRFLGVYRDPAEYMIQLLCGHPLRISDCEDHNEFADRDRDLLEAEHRSDGTIADLPIDTDLIPFLSRCNILQLVGRRYRPERCAAGGMIYRYLRDGGLCTCRMKRWFRMLLWVGNHGKLPFPPRSQLRWPSMSNVLQALGRRLSC